MTKDSSTWWIYLFLVITALCHGRFQTTADDCTHSNGKTNDCFYRDDIKGDQEYLLILSVNDVCENSILKRREALPTLKMSAAPGTCPAAAPTFRKTTKPLSAKTDWCCPSKRDGRVMLLRVLTHPSSCEGSLLPAVKKRTGLMEVAEKQRAWRERSQRHILFN